MTALAVGVPQKWVDNLLSHHALPGVIGGRQGMERSISAIGILAIELVRLLSQELGTSIARAVEIATALVRDPTRSTMRTTSGIEVAVPLSVIERRLHQRLVEAVEAAPSLPRGRPRRR